MNQTNTQVQMRKGLLEYCVLHIISRGEVYTSDLIEELTQAQMIVVEGTLYPLLYSLEKKGLICVAKEIKDESGERKRLYYKLTPKGLKMLEEDLATWSDIVKGMGLVLRSRHAAY